MNLAGRSSKNRGCNTPQTAQAPAKKALQEIGSSNAGLGKRYSRADPKQWQITDKVIIGCVYETEWQSQGHCSLLHQFTRPSLLSNKCHITETVTSPVSKTYLGT